MAGKIFLWRIPAKITEFRNVCVEAENQKDALEMFRRCEWVEGDDPDDTRTLVTKHGKIEKCDEVR